MKALLMFGLLVMGSLQATAQLDGKAVLMDGDFKPRQGQVVIQLMLPEDFENYRAAAAELAQENAPIMSIIESGDFAWITLSERSADRNAWYKIFSVMGIQTIEVDTGEKLGIDDMNIEEVMDYFKVN